MTNQLLQDFVKSNYQLKNPQHKDWETPPDFFKKLNDEFHFTLDAAADHENALCQAYYTKDGGFFKDSERGYQWVTDNDGLSGSWQNYRVFCNPPYDSSLIDWVAKAAKREAEVAVLLLPPSVDTKWFHQYCWPMSSTDGVRIVQRGTFEGISHSHYEILFNRGRLRFWHDGKPGMDPRAGNMLAIFRR